MPNGHSSDTIYELNLEIARLKTKELARKLLASGDLDKPGYSLQDLFKIRDALMILARFGLEDKELLTETLLYIDQKAKE